MTNNTITAPNDPDHGAASMTKANCPNCNDRQTMIGITENNVMGRIPCPACSPGETFQPVVTHDRPSITLAPGALDDVPLVALIRFLADHGLVLAGTTIEKADGPEAA